MKRGEPIAGPGGGHAYGASLSLERPSSDYTARITTGGGGLESPLESPWILWQR